jgi:hypothetical protein
VSRYFVFLAVLLSCSVSSIAQTKSPVSDVIRDVVASRQKNVVAAIEAMPADKFGYKPTADPDDVRTPGPAHCGSQQFLLC